jgi:hypothetical protein
MAKLPEDTAPENWHRFFGASANNQAWMLAETHSGPGCDTELLNAAHAADFHWQAIGTTLQKMRARMLLALAHALAGLGRSALAYADETRAYFLDEPETPDWELAFVHAIHAHAAAVAGDAQAHAASYAAAALAVDAIADKEDREIVERTWRQVPAP